MVSRHGVACAAGVPYAGNSWRMQSYAVYYDAAPPPDGAKRPVLIIVGGGGWQQPLGLGAARTAARG